jgi:tRNA-2-methylthio-N6-dimethylallyladenosine synthase
VQPVLLEKPGRMPGKEAGRSPYLNAVQLEADAGRIGSIQQARIDGAGPNS